MSECKPKIYVACLAAYNNGFLHGEWIDANAEPATIFEQIIEMLSKSPINDAEEFAIHDYEDFAGVQIDEYTSIELVAELAKFIAEHGKLGAALLEFYSDVEEAERVLENNYAGCYSSVEEFAQELTEQHTDIPNNLALYIDYERMARDLEISDIMTFEVAHGEVHVFWQS